MAGQAVMVRGGWLLSFYDRLERYGLGIQKKVEFSWFFNGSETWTRSWNIIDPLNLDLRHKCLPGNLKDTCGALRRVLGCRGNTICHFWKLLFLPFLQLPGHRCLDKCLPGSLKTHVDGFRHSGVWKWHPEMKCIKTWKLKICMDACSANKRNIKHRCRSLLILCSYVDNFKIWNIGPWLFFIAMFTVKFTTMKHRGPVYSL